ncbi:MAG: hypothetical protein IJA55_00980 [Clostridia bacterium]|nr:hypothetical protein [Clostridia bacterium]
MKKIKVISMFLTFVILITSCNLGMMFTSSADETINIADVANLEALAEKDLKNAGTVTINIDNDIDASSISSFSPIDASGTIIIFDGNSKLIKNLHITGGGLFSAVGDGSSFENLGMYDCTITDFDGGSGYGFLAGVMHSGTVKNCFADGSISVYGDSASFIGGLVGSFGGTMENCYSMVDIYTNGSYVGGLLGTFVESETVSNSVSKCYSTGSIDNDGREYIGGLIGKSATPCITNSYTSVCVLNPYADTVKSIGAITGLEADDNVYYDENVSLQRQGDMDPHRCTPSELTSKLNGNGWLSVDGYYPQLAAFVTASGIPESFVRISAISAAVVDVSREDGITTGREFTVVSTPDKYSYAKLTTYDGSSTAVLSDVNQIDWRITGGVDEYYFDPTDLSNFPTNEGATIDGLSGNTYDVNTGKYLFTNTGDIKFTAYSGSYERDIYVHVTTADKNPYIVGGNGTEATPFSVNTYNEFDMIRVYCLDDETGKYHYNLDFALENSNDGNISLWRKFTIPSDKSWMPILGMKGTLNGNRTIFKDLNISKVNEGSTGLFATISNTASIKDIHISDAVVKPGNTDSDGAIILADNGGLLAGSVKDATFTNVIATGVVEYVKNGGTIAGEAYGNTTVNGCLTFGLVSASESAGGIIGTTENNVLAIHTYSSAVVTDAENVGGFFAVGEGDVEDSVFTGNISCSLGGVKHPLVDSGTVTNSYFDWQAAGILNSDFDYATTTAELIKKNNANIELDSNYWGWYDVKGPYTHYPQLKHFAEVTTSNYDSRTSNIAAFSFIYSNSFAPDSASSVSFDKINISNVTRRYEVGDVNRTISMLRSYGTDNGGYIFNPAAPSNFVGFEISVNTGGKQIYSFNAALPAFPCDTRYVMFNVKNIKVNYKFAYANEDEKLEYNDDMHSKGLTTVTNGLNVDYNLFLDSTSTEDFSKSIRFVHAGDSLHFRMTQAKKYDYTVEVYTDAACTNSVSVESSETGHLISTEDLNEIYVVFTIEPNTLPWGIYRLMSN